MSNFPSRCARTSEELSASEERRLVGCRSQRGQRRRRGSGGAVGCRSPVVRLRRRRGDMGRCPRRCGGTDGSCSSWTNDWSSPCRRTSDLSERVRLELRLGLVTAGRDRGPSISGTERTAASDSTSTNVESPRSTGSRPTQSIFSTDLSDWWSIPSLPDVSANSRSSDGEPSSRSVAGIRQQRPNADASPPSGQRR